MNYITVLAEVISETRTETQQTVPIDFIWNQIATLNWLHAVLAVSFGVVYLLYGWRIFKILAVIAFGLLGLFIGMKLGQRAGNQMWGGVIGLVTLVALSIPLMKWAICILGAVAGGMMTGSLWYACGLEQRYILAGVIIGMVAGGMISFIVFKAAVMLFTSLGGSAIMMVGVLSLLNSYEKISTPPTANIENWAFSNTWFLPVALLAPTVIGIIVQNKLIKKSSDWEI